MNVKNNPLKYKNYFSYLYAGAKKTTVVHKVKSIYSFIRKYILVGRIFRYLRIFFIWIQTGAYFLIFSTALFILIPLIAISILGFFLYTISMHKKYNNYFSKIINNKTVCISFKQNENLISEKCSNADIVLYVITDPFTQLTECVRKIDSSTFYISMSYFYSMKKHILDKNQTKVVYNQDEVIS